MFRFKCFLLLMLCLTLQISFGKRYTLDCEISRNHSSCAQLETVDIMRSIKYLNEPETANCKDIRVAQGLSVCYDILPKKCRVLTVATSDDLNDIGTLAFEKYWSKFCSVTVMHYSVRGRNKWDKKEKGFIVNREHGFPIYRLKMWDRRAFTGFFLHANSVLREPIDVLKVQELELEPDKDGKLPFNTWEWLGLTVVADLYNYKDNLACCANREKSNSISGVTVGQLIFRLSFNRETLIDYWGRESGHASNMYAMANVLYDYGLFASTEQAVPEQLWPLQLEHYVQSVGFDYKVQKIVSFMQLPDRQLMVMNREKWAKWRPIPLHAFPSSAQHLADDINRPIHLPPFCKIPESNYAQDMNALTSWVKYHLNSRCHPVYTAGACDYSKTYEGFIPCPSQLTDKMVEEYAVAKVNLWGGAFVCVCVEAMLWTCCNSVCFVCFLLVGLVQLTEP